MLLTKLNSHTPIQISIKNDIDWSRKVSNVQFLVKQKIYPHWKWDCVTEEMRIPGSKLRIDLFNVTKRLAIEVSPDEYHCTYSSFLHKNRPAFVEKIKSDEKKRLWCERNEIKLIELYSEDIENLSQQYILEKYDVRL